MGKIKKRKRKVERKTGEGEGNLGIQPEGDFIKKLTLKSVHLK